MSHSPLPHPGTGPFPASLALPTLSGRCAALATRPSPPRPLVPSSRVYTPPGRLLPCGAGPRGPLPSGDRFVRLARVALFPAYSLGLSCGPIPSLIPCLYPTGPPATLWRGPSGSSSIRGPFRAPSTGRSLPAPFPSAAAPACCVFGVLGPLAPVHRCARSVCGVACTASWASWLLFTAVHALCVVLRARFPGPPGSWSPACTLCLWCCGCGVLSRLVPIHWCARSLCVVACAVSWAAWLLFTGVPASVRCVVYTVSWAPWLLFTGVHALCAVLYVRRPGPPGSCSPVRMLAVCSSHAFYPPPSSSLVLVHALRACLPAFSCRRLLVLVAPLAFAFGSPSVLVRSFGLSEVVEWWSG